MHGKILSKLIRYEIMIRKAVNGHLDGKFKSIFKGAGLEFSDLRTYTYGDDLRMIDWNASSKGHGMFVKLFREEKEQQVFFLLDVSGSQKVGRNSFAKIDLAREICGTIAISAINEASKVGLYCFSDKKELFMAPLASKKHGYQLISKLFDLKPLSYNTNIGQALLFALQILKKRSVVILISDFLDQNYAHNLSALARKHDLIVLHMYDAREVKLPRLGIIPMYNLESNKMLWVNTSSAAFRSQMKDNFTKNKEIIEKICKENRANYLAIRPDDNYVEKLIKLFKERKKYN
jgi:uncharacterized protein (DUF58 family)